VMAWKTAVELEAMSDDDLIDAYHQTLVHHAAANGKEQGGEIGEAFTRLSTAELVMVSRFPGEHMRRYRARYPRSGPE
jgi:hypothetical protein